MSTTAAVINIVSSYIMVAFTFGLVGWMVGRRQGFRRGVQAEADRRVEESITGLREARERLDRGDGPFQPGEHVDLIGPIGWGKGRGDDVVG